jgi:hypothetical protein
MGMSAAERMRVNGLTAKFLARRTSMVRWAIKAYGEFSEGQVAKARAPYWESVWRE